MVTMSGDSHPHDALDDIESSEGAGDGDDMAKRREERATQAELRAPLPGYEGGSDTVSPDRFAGSATGSGVIQLLVGRVLPEGVERGLTERLTTVVNGGFFSNPASYYFRALIGIGMLSSIVGVFVAVGGVLLGVIAAPSFIPSGAWLAFAAISGLLLGPVMSVAGYWYLVAVVEKREGEINQAFPDVVTFMYVLSEGGMDQVDIIHSIADSESTFGEISREFQAIVYEGEYLGIDYMTAMERHANRTPSDSLEQFFTDFLSVSRSGGDLDDFLESKKTLAQREAKESQRAVLDTLQAAARMYVTLSIFPLLIVIMIVALSPVEQLPIEILYGVAYVLIPVLAGGFFLWLWFSVPDSVGSGEMEDDWREGMLLDTIYTPLGLEKQAERAAPDGGVMPEISLHPAGRGVFSTPMLDLLTDGSGVFAEMKKREIKYRLTQIFLDPVNYFKETPAHVFVLSVPLAATVPLLAFVTGRLAGGPTEAVFEWVAFVMYLPLLVAAGPFVVFYELRNRMSAGIYEGFPELLRQISSANDTGMVLLEAIGSAVESTGSKIGDEFATVYAKAKLGVPISTALVELNNKYKSRALARSIRLIEYAHRTTGDITKTLEAAIEALDTRIELLNQRRNETRMQVAYVIVANLVLFGVFLMIDRMLLDLLFGGAQDFASGDVGEEAGVLGEGYDPTVVAMILLHSSVIHAVSSGLIAGYIRNGSIKSGVKYVLILLTIIVGGWWLV